MQYGKGGWHKTAMGRQLLLLDTPPPPPGGKRVGNIWPQVLVRKPRARNSAAWDGGNNAGGARGEIYLRRRRGGRVLDARPSTGEQSSNLEIEKPRNLISENEGHVVRHLITSNQRKKSYNQKAFPPANAAKISQNQADILRASLLKNNKHDKARLCLFGNLHRFTSSSSRPHLADSSPSSHSFSTYPSSRLTFSTVALSPVFFPMLSLIRVSLVSHCPQEVLT